MNRNLMRFIVISAFLIIGIFVPLSLYGLVIYLIIEYFAARKKKKEENKE